MLLLLSRVIYIYNEADLGYSQINVKDNVYALDNNLPRQKVSDH